MSSLTRFTVPPLYTVTRKLASVAMGHTAPDQVLTGARILSTYTDRIHSDREIWIACGRIAAVKPAGESKRLGHSAPTFDCAGGILAPGLVDPHIHIESSMMTACAYAEAALLNGTGNVQRTLGARILLVDTGMGEGGSGDGVRARFGLAVDRIDDAVDIDQSGSWHAGSQTVAWLGEVVQFAGEPAQRVDARLLAAAFPQLAAPATSLAEREDA
jgi:hypothetical protein